MVLLKNKVMEMNVPEKIYISPKLEERTWLMGKFDINAVEYVNADAFIEKSCKLLVDCIEDFMARRMETWDEESKKQTLENLQKALKE